jgi:hypothetical protein
VITFELSDFGSVPDRRIALISPERVEEQDAAQAMSMLGSMFWAFKESGRSQWTVVPPESAEVIVVPHTVDRERLAEWRRSGKLIVFVALAVDADIGAEMLAAHVLVHPFRVSEVLGLLERLEQQLNPSSEARTAAPQSRNGGARDESANPWAFVETFLAVHEVQNAEAWLVGRDGSTTLLWLKGDGSCYAAEPSIVHAIRRGAIDLSCLPLRQGSKPHDDGPTLRAGIELGWFAGYHASENLAPWLSPDARFRLARHADYDLIRPSHSQIRICEILAETASDVAELAACSHVSVEEAVRTVNALAACGLLALPAAPRFSKPLQVAAAVTSGLSTLLRASADFLDARTSALVRRNRPP